MLPSVRGGQAVAAAAVTALGSVIVLPAAVRAHGVAPDPPSISTLVTGWSLGVEIWLPVLFVGAIYWLAVRKVGREHPANPVPRRRVACWYAGLAAIVLALASPIERYDTTLFSVHMVQHMLLVMVAAPLLVLGAPVTLLLRVATPEARKRWILPFLHSRVVRAISFPVVTWLLFNGFMFVSHFSPLFDAALEDTGVHMVEHALYLSTALLFWWPVFGVDPSPWRLPYPGRVLYVALSFPFNTFLGLAIMSATDVLYRHYATLQRSWGMSPLEDQVWAGGIMWGGGDLVFLIELIVIVAAWLKAEEMEGRRVDARLDRERAAHERAAAREQATAQE